MTELFHAKSYWFVENKLASDGQPLCKIDKVNKIRAELNQANGQFMYSVRIPAENIYCAYCRSFHGIQLYCGF